MLTPMQHVMQTGETAWAPTGVGKVSLCTGLHVGRWSHRVVIIFQDLCSFSGLPFLRCRRVLFRWAGIVLAPASAIDASEIWVVSVGGTSLAKQVAVQTCSSLFTRDESVAGASFVLGSLAKWNRSDFCAVHKQYETVRLSYQSLRIWFTVSYCSGARNSPLLDT